MIKLLIVELLILGTLVGIVSYNLFRSKKNSKKKLQYKTLCMTHIHLAVKSGEFKQGDWCVIDNNRCTKCQYFSVDS